MKTLDEFNEMKEYKKKRMSRKADYRAMLLKPEEKEKAGNKDGRNS